MLIRRATPEDLPAVTCIYNEAVLTSTASFDIDPRSEEEAREWFETHRDPSYPLLVASSGGEVLGWACISPFHPRPAYRFTGETSVYVAEEARRRGVGGSLLSRLVEEAVRLGYHSLMALIVSDNEASVGLYRGTGFTEVGHYREVGRKFGRWHDIRVMQRVLQSAEEWESE